jgi:hypothetical protein
MDHSAKQANDELVGAHEVQTRVNLAVAAAHLHAPMDQLRLSLPPSLVVVDSYSIGSRLQAHSFRICPFSTRNGTSTLPGRFPEIISFISDLIYIFVI